MSPTSEISNQRWSLPPWVAMGIILWGVLYFNLALPLISGLAVYVLFGQAHRLFLRTSFSKHALFLAAWSTIVGFCLVVGFGVWAVVMLIDSNQGAGALMVRLTETLKLIKDYVPPNIAQHIPPSSYSLLAHAQEWLMQNSAVLAGVGKKLVTGIFHVFIGAFVGLLSALSFLHPTTSPPSSGWLRALGAKMNAFAQCFERVFFAQFYIALLNTVFTGTFLALILPIWGVHLPFLPLLILITFLMGFVPILGNLVSNTAITLTALSVSLPAAVGALGFLIVVHKVEYFLNALIVGNRIKVRSYELLTSMLVFEAVFGVWGLVLAPVMYSYIKQQFQNGDPPLPADTSPPQTPALTPPL